MSSPVKSTIPKISSSDFTHPIYANSKATYNHYNSWEIRARTEESLSGAGSSPRVLSQSELSNFLGRCESVLESTAFDFPAFRAGQLFWQAMGDFELIFCRELVFIPHRHGSLPLLASRGGSVARDPRPEAKSRCGRGSHAE